MRLIDMDVISRQAALDCFHDWIDKYGDVHTPDEMVEYRAIEALPSAQSEQRWIPVRETVDIPNYGVLCCDRHGEELVGWLLYIGNQWVCESNEEIMYNPVAWMSLPEPYREEQDGH